MNGSRTIVERLRRGFAARGETKRGTDQCPEPARIWDAAHGSLAAEETHLVVEHFVVCPACAADWRAAIRPVSPGDVRDSRSTNAAVALQARRPAMLWTRFAAAAAAVLAVALLGILRVADPIPAGPVYRTADAVIRSLVPEDAALPRERAVLRWTPVGEDAVYSIEVGKVDLTTLASARELDRTEFTIPPEALEQVEPGESIAWQVEAQLPDGRRVASEAFLHRIE